MSALTERVPAADLRKDDFVTISHEGADTFAIVRRISVPDATDQVLVDYYILGGGTGTVALGPDDRVQRVRESEAS